MITPATTINENHFPQPTTSNSVAATSADASSTTTQPAAVSVMTDLNTLFGQLWQRVRKSPTGRVLNWLGSITQDNLPYHKEVAMNALRNEMPEVFLTLEHLSVGESLTSPSIMLIHKIIKQLFPEINIMMVTRYFDNNVLSNDIKEPNKETLTIIPILAGNQFTLLAHYGNKLCYFNSNGGSLDSHKYTQLDIYLRTTVYDVIINLGEVIKTVRDDLPNNWTRPRVWQIKNEAEECDLIKEDFNSSAVYAMTYVYQKCCEITGRNPRKDQHKGLATCSKDPTKTSPRAPRRFLIDLVEDYAIGEIGQQGETSTTPQVKVKQHRLFTSTKLKFYNRHL